jgi:hypothetical protein
MNHVCKATSLTEPSSGDGLLLLRRKAPLSRRPVAYFCSGAHTPECPGKPGALYRRACEDKEFLLQSFIAQMFEFPLQIVRLADFDDDRRRLLGQCLEFLLPLVILCIYA